MYVETQYEFFEGVPVYDDYRYLFNNLSYDAAPVVLNYDDYSDSGDYGTYSFYKGLYEKRIISKIDDMTLGKINISKAIAIQIVTE